MNEPGPVAEGGRAARRGVIVLFGFTGWLLTYWWKDQGPDYPRLALGLASIAICIGLWCNWRWARWLAMGACFLSVIAAFAMPVILELWRPFEMFQDGATQAALFTCATAAAIGVIGYKGLGYFRSAAAWKAFSNDQKQHDALARESSSKVVVSAACIALLLSLVGAARGVGGPRVSWLPGPSAKLPDLVINSLCISGQNLVRAEVQNRGRGGDTGRFNITYSNLTGRGGFDRSAGPVPSPGQSIYVVLDNAINQSERDGLRQWVHLQADSTRNIRESDENNNTADFEIVYHYFHPGNLPTCPLTDTEDRIS